MNKLNNLQVLFSDLLTLTFLGILKNGVAVSSQATNSFLILLVAIIVLKIILLLVMEGFYFRNMRLKISYDALTKIYNRGALDKMLPEMYENSKKGNKPFCVILADIDHFKTVNDEYGHSAGDFILKSFAGIIKSNIRAGVEDVFRYGGEEFTICLRNTTLEEGLMIAERLRLLVEEACLTYGNETIRITSSFGVAQIGNDITNSGELLKQADLSLYEAKNTGRNRCIALQQMRIAGEA